MSIVYMSGCFVLRVSIDARQIVHAFKTGELHSIIAAQMLLVFVQDDEAGLLQNSQRPRPSGCSNVPAAEPFRLSGSVGTLDEGTGTILRDSQGGRSMWRSDSCSCR